jgi:nucleolar complex protein 3
MQILTLFFLKQTETLKLIFAMYFRIVKLPSRSPLLPGALEGLARFAHLINVDFFKDLLAVLRDLTRDHAASEALDDGDNTDQTAVNYRTGLRERLLCVVTAFELLSGQGA